jgi:hypothetical protein
MIVKYWNEGKWCYRDGIEKVTKSGIFTGDYLEQLYNENLEKSKIQMPLDFSEGINKINKVFMQLSEIIKEYASFSHSECVLRECDVNSDLNIFALVLDKKDENTLLITCSEVYLMNDKGQTIERLV